MSHANDTPQNTKWKPALKEQMVACFTKPDDVQDLCFHLNISYHELSGESVSSKIRELILYVEKHNKVNELFEQLAELRPHMTWPKPPSPPKKTTRLPAPEQKTQIPTSLPHFFSRPDPHKAKKLLERGKTFFKVDNFDLAIELFTEALGFDETGEIYAQRALAYIKKEEYESALNDANKAIYLNPEISTFFIRGMVYHFQNRHLEAIADFESAVKLDGHVPIDFYFFWGICYWRAGMSEEALASFNYFIKSGDDSTHLYAARLQRAEIYKAQKMYPKALIDYNQAIKLRRDKPITYYYRGQVHQEMGEKEKAKLDFQRYLELSNNLEKKEKVIHWLETLKDEKNNKP